MIDPVVVADDEEVFNYPTRVKIANSTKINAQLARMMEFYFSVCNGIWCFWGAGWVEEGRVCVRLCQTYGKQISIEKKKTFTGKIFRIISLALCPLWNYDGFTGLPTFCWPKNLSVFYWKTKKNFYLCASCWCWVRRASLRLLFYPPARAQHSCFALT